MTVRLALGGLWLLAMAAPVGWWLLTRRRVDVWRALPVSAALLGADGAPRRRTGPDQDRDLALDSALPAPGTVVRASSRDGTAVAVTGLRGGALAVAVPDDPVRARRDELLAELVPRLAHELNTPLTAVVGHLDLLAHEQLPDQARGSVAVCQQEVVRLAELARDLLTLTKLRAGSATRRVSNAGALAEEAAAGLLDLADRSGVALRVHTPVDRVLVDVADGDLVRALRNLLRNAVQHAAGPHPEVHLSVLAERDAVTFTVTDTGPGILAADLPRLCQPLVRGPGNAYPGAGLGLAIVAEVLAAHGSELTTTRHATGSGLSFRLARVAA